LTPGGALLSKDEYTYDAMGNVITWQQQTDANTPMLWTDGHDAADQLTSAVETNTAITSPPVFSGTYGYDYNGNLTSSTLNGLSRSPGYNALNQLTSSTPSGSQSVAFTGSLNELATVTVNGGAATVNGSNGFLGLASLTPGTTGTVPVVATDSHGNSRTNQYQVVVPAQPSYSPTFDADGNETATGAGQSYTWDVKNELAAITQGTNSYAFGYDPLGRRISETDNGTLTKQWVWDGDTVAEERNAGNTVTKRFYARGEQISGTNYFYTRDHLGSIREMTTGTSGTILARYDYDPYGRPTQIQGTLTSDFQYAGYYEHLASGLNLTKYRAYDPITSRWLSRDPLTNAEMRQGPNLYEYCSNDPVKNVDPLGKQAYDFDPWIDPGFPDPPEPAPTPGPAPGVTPPQSPFNPNPDQTQVTPEHPNSDQIPKPPPPNSNCPGMAPSGAPIVT
jgi:RHS repeat-associated protein